MYNTITTYIPMYTGTSLPSSLVSIFGPTNVYQYTSTTIYCNLDFDGPHLIPPAPEKLITYFNHASGTYPDKTIINIKTEWGEIEYTAYDKIITKEELINSMPTFPEVLNMDTNIKIGGIEFLASKMVRNIARLK